MRRGPLPFWPAIAGCVVIAIALRLPFMQTPLSVDEGGFAAIARAWSRGGHLYREIWVDRPQGLLLEYRAALALFGDGGIAVRALAVVAACGITIAIGLAVRALLSARAGIIAAALFATLSVAPTLEGFAANGELLTALPSTIAIALAVSWAMTQARVALLLGAGLSAGFAFLVKQSGYDAGIAIALWLALGSLRGTLGRSHARRGLIALITGGLVMLALSLLHGALTGWHDFWFALADYRLSVESVYTAPISQRAQLLWSSFGSAAPATAPLLVFAALGIRPAWRNGQARLLPLWLALSFSGFLLGGLFHPHYYIGLIAPLSALSAFGIVEFVRRFSPRALAVGLAALLIAPIVVALPSYTADGLRSRSLASSNDSRIVTNAAVARYIDTHSSPTERIYAMFANASLYFAADRPAAFRYLWFLGVKHIPGATGQLNDTLAGRRAPLLIAQYQKPGDIDPSGGIATTLARRYRQVAVVDGIPILRLQNS